MTLTLARGIIIANTMLWHLPGIQKIIALLERADSCYLHGFLGLSRSLEGEVEVAVKTANALSILVDSCTALSTSPIQVRLGMGRIYAAVVAIFAIIHAMVTCWHV